MSTWHDLIDDGSVQDFVDGTAAAPPEIVQVLPDVTEPPPSSSTGSNLLDTELIEAEDEDESLGITIVPSVPTTDSFSLNDSHASVQEEEEEDGRSSVETEDSSVPLSLNPSSVASSVMTEFSNTSLSCVDSDEEDEEDAAAAAVVDDNRSNPESASESLASSSVSATTPCKDHNNNHSKNPCQNDTEWQVFRENAMKVLNSLQDTEEREMLLAEIAAMESQYFPDHIPAVKQQALTTWSWPEWTALAAAGVAVTSVALFRWIKAR